jgi:predicted nucleic acid-binding protein
MPGSFFDTNVLIYLASADAAKADRAESLLAARGGTISVQVLNELTHVSRRKMRLSWDETQTFLTTIRDLVSVRPLSLEIHDAGLGLARRYGFSVYDAMIVASARDANCETLWSEDMQDGMMIDGDLRIVNPFRAG